MLEIDGIADAFCGTKTVLHMKEDAKLDREAVMKVLEKKKIKVKGELEKDADALL